MARKFVAAAVSAITFFAASAFLCGCGASPVPNAPPQAVDVVSLDPQNWNVLYSPGMPAHPSPSSAGAWYFDFPGASGSVHYVQTPYRETTIHKTLTIVFKITATDAAYNAQVDPSDANPATFHLFLERQGDDLTQDYYRWWSATNYTLGSADNTVVTLTVPLTYDQWSSVFGHHNQAEFEATLNDLEAVGFTFGGQYFFGHGVNVTSGQARFTLIDYRIE